MGWGKRGKHADCVPPPPLERGCAGAAEGPAPVRAAQRGPASALPGVPRGHDPPSLAGTQQATGAAAALERGGPGQGGDAASCPTQRFGAPPPPHALSHTRPGLDFPRRRRRRRCTRPASARPMRGSKTWRPPSGGSIFTRATKALCNLPPVTSLSSLQLLLSLLHRFFWLHWLPQSLEQATMPHFKVFKVFKAWNVLPPEKSKAQSLSFFVSLLTFCK